jgi:hypothetical protein
MYQVPFLSYTASMSTNDQAKAAVKPPSPSFLGKLELLSIEAIAKALGIPEKPKAAKFRKLTEAQEQELREIEHHAVTNFEGDLTQLEAALGMLRLGHHYGWKVLYILHSKKTIRTYEGILGRRIRDIFDETGPSSYRSIGFNLAQRFSNFWKVAGGEVKIPRRKDSVD